MNLWERSITNIQKGYDRLSTFAAVFSDRVRAEITIIRLRMQVDDVQRNIADQHRAIGKKLLDLRRDRVLPDSPELLFKNDEIAAALEKIALYEKDLENILDELKSEANVIQTVPLRKDEETSA